jgi:MoaA/NifB/PqqE/SkfB family radical SAM enzyme
MKTKNKDYPLIVKINVTETCFFNCKTCFSWKNKIDKCILPLDVYKKFFKDLGKIKGANTSVNFTGGEPLSSSNIFNLISMANKQVKYTNLNTNGWLLNKINIKKLFDSGLTDITISLDGSSAKKHDDIRGMPGSFKKIIEASKDIKEYYKSKGKDINVGIIFLVSALNIDDVINTIKLVKKNKHMDYVFLNAVNAPIFGDSVDIVKRGQKAWFENEKYSYLWPKYINKIRKLYSEIIFLKKQGFPISNDIERLKMQYLYFSHPKNRAKNIICSKNNDIHLDNFGNIFHCVILGDKIGNIKEESIDNIWNNDLSKKSKQIIIKCNVNCHELINCGKINV